MLNFCKCDLHHRLSGQDVIRHECTNVDLPFLLCCSLNHALAPEGPRSLIASISLIPRDLWMDGINASANLNTWSTNF